MSNFVDDSTSLPFPKTDLEPLKAEADPTKWVVADDWNALCQASVDIRGKVRGSQINVKAFGAVGDGVVDDAPAITAAIASVAATANGAAGGFVFFPKGTYLCGSGLVLSDKIGLRGDSTANTSIKASSSFSGASLIRNQHQDGTQEFAFLESLTVDGGGKCSTAVVDWVSLFVNSFIRDVLITNGANVGLHIGAGGTPGGMGPLLIENVWVTNNVGHNVLIEEIAGNSGAGDGICCINLVSEHQGSNKSAIYLKGLGSCASWNFFNVHIELGQGGGATAQTGITIDGVPDVLIDGVQLLTGDVAAVTAGIAITTAIQNTRIQIRGVVNANLINPVLSDAKNSVTVGAIAVPVYVTPEVNVRGGLRFTPGSAASAVSLVAQSSAGVDRAWFDTNGRLTGASLDGGGISIVGDTANNRPIVLVPSAASGQSNEFGWYFPAASGSVLRERSITGGLDVRTLGTDGSETHHQLSTFQSSIKGSGARAAAPSSGTHVLGEIVFNADPVASGFIGWVCVTAGSPGTWKSWGVISA